MRAVKDLKGRLFIFSVLAMSSLLAGCGQSDGQGGQAPPPEVAVITAVRSALPVDLTYTARTAGSREIEVRARVSGILLQRRYEEGKRVRQGETMFLIDPEQFRASAAQARADLAVQRAQLQQAQRERDRVVPLFEKKAVSQKSRDEAVSGFEVAQANVLAAEARLRAAELDLGYTEVRAPITGLTSRESRSEGSLITAGTESSLLTRIVQFDPLYVEFSVPEEESMLLRERLAKPQLASQISVKLILPDGSEYSQAAQLNFLDNAVETTSGTVNARAVLPNADMQLLPGQFVRVRLEGVNLADVVALPRRALMSSSQGHFVWVVDDQQTVAVRPVQLGRSVGDQVVVTGLNGGERVIVEGLLKVQPGSPVTAIAYAPAGSEPPADQPAATGSKPADTAGEKAREAA